MNDTNISQQKPLLFIISAFIVLIIIALFIKFPYYIKGPCQFSAQYNWSLIEVEPGKLLSRLSGRNPHQVQDFNLLQFDRPDFVNFSLAPSIEAGQYVEKDDLIGTISSTENKIRLDELTGQLERAKAELNMITTGEKQAVQDEALQELNYAKSAYDLYKPTIMRKKQLHQDSLISQSEWEQAEAEFKLLELNISIASAKLKTVRSGDKTEAAEVFKSDIMSIENQIHSLETKLAAEIIRTPINGILLDSYQQGTLCSVAKTDTMIVQIPIDQKNRYYAKSGMKLQVKIAALANKSFSGNIISVGRNAQMINNKMMFILTGTIENSNHTLFPGMTGYVKINCDKIPLWMLIKRWWHSSRFLQ
ncbi:MAG: hypothetical protein JSW07_15200 [bacterium]|nr:MAG: hypothetical protein JSW07_15200 [bacterium]